MIMQTLIKDFHISAMMIREMTLVYFRVSEIIRWNCLFGISSHVASNHLYSYLMWEVLIFSVE